MALTPVLLAALPLWFFADFDGVPRINGSAYTEPLVDGHADEGRFGRGHAFVDDAKNAAGKFWRITDPELLASFPRDRGAFACWFRSPEDCLDKGQSPGFGYCGFWQFQWVWRGGSFNTGTAYGESAVIKDFRRSTEWRHFAAVWNDEKLVVYLNGEKAGEKAKPQRMDMKDVPRRVLRIGSGFDGSPAANLVMDEIAIFSRDLTPDEVKGLATAKTPLVDHRDEVLLTPVAFPIYWRNQADAALRTRVLATQDRELTVKAAVGGRALPEAKQVFRKGTTRLAVPFDPSRFRVGTYPWEFALVDAAGRRVAGASGEMEIRARVERDAFKVFNWGGYKSVSVPFMRKLGINASNCGAKDHGSIRNLARQDVFANPRYENIRGVPVERQVDVADVMRRTDADLAPLEGLHLWAETLVNSEVYGAGVGKATGVVSFVDFARKQLGREPDFGYRTAPIEIDHKKLAARGGKTPRGVIRRGDCPQLDTLCWTMAKGHPNFLTDRATAKAIERLQPGNVVWSEPMFEGLAAGLEMVADWHYEYSTASVLYGLRSSSSPCRAYGRKYQPTVSQVYWDGGSIYGRHPTKKGKDGKPVKVGLCQSADEVLIKTWMALSAVPAHALSHYEADKWEWSLKGEPTVAGDEPAFVEPDVAERFGRGWHERLAPVADLFRDLPNEKAPVALVLLSECRYAAGLGWGQVHYPRQLAEALVRTGIPFDIVGAHELENGGLVGYRYALLPMANVLYEEHDRALEAAARSGVRIVTDAYAFKTYPGGVRLETLTYPAYVPHFPRIHKAVQDWLNPLAPALRKKVAAWSDCDAATNGFTFVKTCGPVRYVSVVNDRRAADCGERGLYLTNSWYRPMGAPQRITTHFNIPAGAAVYEFNGREGSKVSGFQGFRFHGAQENSLACDYAPADGKVFCVYPKALKKLSVSREGEALEVTLVDVDGKPAPGRQVVEVEVRDSSGALHDETGRYVMEKGRLVVPLRFADDDPPRGLFSAWTASVRELTTGFTDDCKIR